MHLIRIKKFIEKPAWWPFVRAPWYTSLECRLWRRWMVLDGVVDGLQPSLYIGRRDVAATAAAAAGVTLKCLHVKNPPRER